MKTTNTDPRPVSTNSLWKQAVIGLGDGLTIGIAVSAALTAVFVSSDPIISYALCIILLGGIIIGIGGYFSAKYRMERLSKKTKQEEEREQALETEKTIRLFKSLNLDADMQEQAKEEIEKENEEWKAYLRDNSQNFETPIKTQLPITALMIGISFIVGGILGLIPYWLKTDSKYALLLSVCLNIPLLLLVGGIKSSVNGEAVVWGSLRLLFLGAAVASLAYFVAGIFTR